MTKIAQKEKTIKQLRLKAALFDELIELIEDKGFGYLMQSTEKEKEIDSEEAAKELSL